MKAMTVKNISSARCLAALLGFLMAFSVSQSAIQAASISAELPSFDGAAGWLNSAPLTPQSLRGKVVLVDFWEYTCINCLRTLPYLRTWYTRYHYDGLVIVGVHTPEFSFSADPKNIDAADKRLEVTWPVALDPKFVVWNTFHNDVWPHEYLYNQQGQLVDQTSGEGGYQHTERAIQRLLLATNPGAHFPEPMPLLPQDNYLKPGAKCYLGTPEAIVGSEHGLGVENFPPNNGEFQDPTNGHTDGRVYLNGKWNISQEAAVSTNDTDGAYVAMRYHAIQVVSVLSDPLGSTDVILTQDGKPIPREDAASDVKFDGRGRSYVTVNASRAYELLKNRHFGTHELRLYPQSAGVGMYSFDFESCEQGTDN